MNYSHKITIQKQTKTVDAVGEQLDQWTTHRVMFCSAAHLGGRELQLAQTMHADADILIDARWIPAVTPAMRILMDGEILNILDVKEFADQNKKMIGQRFLQIICRKIVG